jgi:hypothetical protein
MRFYKTAILSVIALAIGAGQASADNGWAVAARYGYGGFNNFAIRPYVPAPPYFALHPPVYYGARYARPYGDSPFAAFPQLQPGPGYHAKPYVDSWVTVNNPYCPAVVVPTPVASPVVQHAPVQPLLVDNPHFKSERTQLTQTVN